MDKSTIENIALSIRREANALHESTEEATASLEADPEYQNLISRLPIVEDGRAIGEGDKAVASTYIPERLYRLLLSVSPRLCVDTVIQCAGKLLLLRRRIEPDRGKWSLPGGRLLVDESLTQGAVRKVKQETGYEVNQERLRLLGIVEYWFPERHDVTIVYLCSTESTINIQLDQQHDAYDWFSHAPSDINPTLANLLRPLWK